MNDACIEGRRQLHHVRDFRENWLWICLQRFLQYAQCPIESCNYFNILVKLAQARHHNVK